MAEARDSTFMLQAVVFCVVVTAFTTIYITQPVLPVLREEFQADAFQVSFTVSAVILGIALSNMAIGDLADRIAVHRMILIGGVVVSVCCVIAAVTYSLWMLIGVRFVQGLFIPTLTTCVVAYLARTLPMERLNVVMGSYVSATVMGGLGGRLLGGWIHPPAHWRYAFATVAVVLIVATAVAVWRLREPSPAPHHSADRMSYYRMLRRSDLLRLFIVAFASMFVFASVFNYLPFHLSARPLNIATEVVTALYLTYIIGIFMGPVAGRISNRLGNGWAMAAGAVLFTGSLLLLLIPSLWIVALGLAGACAGYFTVHAAAVGALNRKLHSGRGRANALYVLFYYLGASTGITVCGFAWTQGGWKAVVLAGAAALAVVIAAGLFEHRAERRTRVQPT